MGQRVWGKGGRVGRWWGGGVRMCGLGGWGGVGGEMGECDKTGGGGVGGNGV